MTNATAAGRRKAPTRLPAAGTTVVLFATTPAGGTTGPAALLTCEGSTSLTRLLSDLGALGVTDAVVVTRPQWRPAIEAAVASGPLVPSVRDSAGLSTDLRLVAEVAGAAPGSVVLAMADIVTHRSALAGLLADPRVSTGVLSTGNRRRARWSSPITNARGRIVSAGSAYHATSRRSAFFLGVLRCGPADIPALCESATQLAEIVADGIPAAWQAELDARRTEWTAAAIAAKARAAELDGAEDLSDQSGESLPDQVEDAGNDPRDIIVAADADLDPEAFTDQRDEIAALVACRTAAAENDVSALVLVGLVRSGVTLTNSYLRSLFWARPLTQADADLAAERLATYDEDKLVLASAVKASDGFFTTFLVSPYSRYVARWSARVGLTPNIVTVISMLLGIVSAAAFATGSRAGLIVGAILLQLAFTADCVDGQLARYTRQFSPLGAWLDSVFDRGKEYAVFVGLALGSLHGFDDDVWLLAGSALLIQTIRHVIDFSWAATSRRAVVDVQHAPLLSVGDGRGGTPLSERIAQPQTDAPTTEAAPVRKVSLLTRYRRLDRARPIYWAKRIMQFPIGERFALISILAAVSTPRTTFVVFLAVSVFALTKGLAGRVLRSSRR